MHKFLLTVLMVTSIFGGSLVSATSETDNIESNTVYDSISVHISGSDFYSLKTSAKHQRPSDYKENYYRMSFDNQGILKNIWVRKIDCALVIRKAKQFRRPGYVQVRFEDLSKVVGLLNDEIEFNERLAMWGGVDEETYSARLTELGSFLDGIRGLDSSSSRNDANFTEVVSGSSSNDLSQEPVVEDDASSDNSSTSSITSLNEEDRLSQNGSVNNEIDRLTTPVNAFFGNQPGSGLREILKSSGTSGSVITCVDPAETSKTLVEGQESSSTEENQENDAVNRQLWLLSSVGEVDNTDNNNATSSSSDSTQLNNSSNTLLKKCLCYGGLGIAGGLFGFALYKWFGNTDNSIGYNQSV